MLRLLVLAFLELSKPIEQRDGMWQAIEHRIESNQMLIEDYFDPLSDTHRSLTDKAPQYSPWSL